jgi:hypothetical protein
MMATMPGIYFDAVENPPILTWTAGMRISPLVLTRMTLKSMEFEFTELIRA